jgi:hypothetical protein
MFREGKRWLKVHVPGTSREELKTAQNALLLTLKLAETTLDGLPVYGPKAAIGTLLRIVEAVQVRYAFLLFE